MPIPYAQRQLSFEQKGLIHGRCVADNLLALLIRAARTEPYRPAVRTPVLSLAANLKMYKKLGNSLDRHAYSVAANICRLQTNVCYICYIMFFFLCASHLLCVT